MRLLYRVIFFVVLVGVVFIFATNQGTDKPTPPTVETKFEAVTSKEILVKNDSGYDVRIEYPISSNANINEALEAKANFWFDEFLSYPYESNENYDYSLSVRFSVIEGTDTVTYVFLNNGYTGGAHDFLETYTFTFLKRGGRELELVEVIESNSFPKLQKLARQELVKKYITGDLPTTSSPLLEQQINEGTQSLDDFARFAISDEGLVFFFPPYQIGPWSAGAHDLELSFAQVRLAGVLLNPARKVTFTPPANFSSEYVEALDWPPSVQILPEPFACTAAGEPTNIAGRTEERSIDGRKYCVTEVMGAAAGSAYTQYAYAFEEGDQTIILTFSIRVPTCANYDEPKRSECQSDQDKLDIDKTIGNIVRTLSL